MPNSSFLHSLTLFLSRESLPLRSIFKGSNLYEKPRHVSRSLRRLFSNGQSNDRNEDASTRQPEPLSDAATFYPSLWDVLKTRYILQWKAFQQSLPAELVDAIIDAAEYWPSTERRMEGIRRIANDRDQVLLKTVPLCYDRKVCSSFLRWLPCAHPHSCYMIIETRAIRTLQTTSTPHSTPLPEDSLPHFLP